MKHLKQFETEVAYTQFKDTEDYVLPNVSYVKENKGVKYERKKSYMLRAKYNATPDNLVAFTNASNVNSMSVNGTPIEIEPIKIETTAFDVLGENISVNMETGEAAFPESYLIKSHISSWSFKAKDPNYVINENTHICMLGMMEGMAMAQPIPFEEAMEYFTINDDITFEAFEELVNNINENIQYGMYMGFTLADVDMNNNTITFIDTEHQAAVKTGGLPTYSFDSEGTYDVKIGIADPTIKMLFTETPLVSIEIGNDITSIGSSAFSYCSNLTSVTIGNSVTSIGEYVFSNCSSLTSITIPDSVTSIGDNAFRDCRSLISIIIPNSVISFGRSAFAWCNNLTSITIPNNLTSIGEYVFSNCSSLTSITIPDSVTSIGKWAFLDCSSLTSITIPDSVTSIGGSTFSNCSSLTSITIPDSVTSIGDRAFNYCTSLTSITIPDSVTNIGDYAFYSCDMTSITIPDSVTSIGEWAFSGSSLESVTIGNSVTSIGEGAFNSINLDSIVVSSGNTKYDSRDNCNCIIETATNTIIKGCNNSVIPNGVTSIGDSAFAYCSSLESVTIPDSVTNIKGVAFHGCDLDSIVVSSGNTKYDSRDNCNCIIETATNKLIRGSNNSVIPNGVTGIEDSAFAGCDNLTSITIPDSVTSIGEWAFELCDLRSITCYATIAPNIQSYTFGVSLPHDGTLYVPTGSDYSSWMSTDDHYLGKYNWTIEYI